MINSSYKLLIEGKDVKRYIKYLYNRGITFNKLYITNNKYYAIVDTHNYKKITEFKTTYKIKIERVYGLLYFKEFIKNNKIFIMSVIFSLLVLYILSNIVFDVDIIHSDKELVNLIKQELDKNGLNKYSFVKDYDKRLIIKNKILDNNRENLEWLEIERVGVKYVVRMDKRIIKNINVDNKPCNIVASHDGIIKKIVADKGEVVKKINDYVKKGDIIISGSIHKGDEVKDNVNAKGDVYAEVWYKVKVTLPINYHEEKKLKNSNNIINIKLFNKELNLFEKIDSKDEIIYKKELFTDLFGLFSISLNNIEKKQVKDELNTIINEADAINMAREKILSKLSTGEYIISQKKLKTDINNSTITIEVFFKVYENISSINYYSTEGS